jgi:hypothetical protein
MFETSSESPAPVRVVSEAIKEYVERLGPIWIEGEISELNERSGGMAFMRLRDTSVDMSLSVMCYKNVLSAVQPLPANARVVIHAKAFDRHVDLALKTSLEENLAMVRDSVAHLRSEGQRVFLDAEHFLDGYRANRDYALEVIRVAMEAGADVAALCDTNGGMLPDEIADVVHDVLTATSARIGIHCHNDTGCAVANSMAAVAAGATHVQGTGDSLEVSNMGRA